MVDEVRAGRLDLMARAKFAKDKEQIHETRSVLADAFAEEAPAVIDMDQRALSTAAKLRQAADNGFVEVG